MKRIVVASAVLLAAPSFFGAAKAVPIDPGQGVDNLPVVTETGNLLGFLSKLSVRQSRPTASSATLTKPSIKRRTARLISPIRSA